MKNNIKSSIGLGAKIFLYFNICFWTIVGLMPWSIRISEFNKKCVTDINDSPFVISFWGSAYNIILIITHIIVYIIVFPTIKEFYDQTVVSDLVKYAQLGIVILQNISVICMWSMYVLRQRIIILFGIQLRNVDTILKNCADYEINKNIYPYYITIINLLACTFILINSAMHWPPSAVIDWTIPTIVSILILVQYSMLLNLINERLKNINQTILKLGNISKRYEFQIFSVTKWPIKKSVLSQIINLKYAYIELWNANNNLTSFFGFPILFSLVYFVSILVFCSYYVLLYNVFAENEPTRDMMDDLWYIVIICPLLTLATMVNSTSRKMKQTIDNIHWVLNLCTTSGEVEKALVRFSHELLNREADFGIYGVIVLDGSLLSSILGSVLTYVVFIVQFQLAR